MAETSGNFYLNLEQMTENAQIIVNSLLPNNWTFESICGMLGNMQQESTVNAGLWENLDAGNLNIGFGLVQWTPATNYINWAIDNGYNTYELYGKISPQIMRILYELQNGLQWISTIEYPLSFTEFTQSVDTPEFLASAFLKNYERAGVEVEETRRRNARYWYDNLNGGTPIQPRRKMPLWMYLRKF